jgi:two-component system OmpR family sensor kinase
MGEAGAPPSDRGAPARRQRSLTWRISLFVLIVVSVALLVMVAASGYAMSRWMTGNVDGDLQDSLHRVASQSESRESNGQSAVGRDPVCRGRQTDSGPLGPGVPPAADTSSDSESQSGAPRSLGGPGFSKGALLLISEGGQVQAGVVQDYDVVALDAAAQEQLLGVDADGRGHTVRLADVGSFRVMAEDTGAARVVVGQSLAPSNRTVTTLMWVEGALAVLLAAVVAVVGRRWVGREMRPLARVSSTARRIGALDLQSTRIEPFDRVDASDAQPGTEVGDVGQALNTMIDNVESALTERVRSEQRLRQFVADASHELRTPLASIQGYTQLLRKDSIEPDLALSRIGSESQRMSGLVEDMLLLARLDAGRELRLTPVDLVPLVIDAVSDAHAAGPDHMWALDIDEDPGDSCVVNGDEMGLRQVLANLVNNARVHTPPGTHVTIGVHARPAGSVSLTVADDGPGIPPDVRAKVFDRFVRGDASRTRSGTGSSGLGLSIVASITRGLGGRVDVISSDRGTTFTVVLPHLEVDPGSS